MKAEPSFPLSLSKPLALVTALAVTLVSAQASDNSFIGNLNTVVCGNP